MIKSWFSPKVIISKSTIEGKGMYSIAPIFKDEIVAIKGGYLLNKSEFNNIPDECKQASLQIAEDVFMAPTEINQINDVMNFINHSCDPNAGLKGQIATVAMRDIKIGEEITGDYCVAYSDSFFQFLCRCGSINCRKEVTSIDWQDKNLQEKYYGYFCQYLTDKITAKH